MELDSSNRHGELSEQLSSILREELRVVKAIWSDVPFSARSAYEALEARFLAGMDVTSYEFWAREKDVIRASVRGLRAKLRQTLVEDAFANLLTNVKADGKPAVLFEKSPEPVNDGLTILDAYSYEKAEVEKMVVNIDEQARQDIINTVVKPDELAKIGLVRPGSLSGGWLIADRHNDSRVIVAPTLMQGVFLRFNHPLGTDTPIVELVPHRAAA